MPQPPFCFSFFFSLIPGASKKLNSAEGRLLFSGQKVVSCKESSLLLGMCINTPIDGKKNVHHHLIFNIKVKLLVLNLKAVACLVKARFSTPPLSSFLFFGTTHFSS